MQRLYLDNAATSFPKPKAVHEAMLRYATQVGASPGRGTYAESLEGAALIARCRRRLCELFNHPSPKHCVFTLNTTDALNMAIWGIVEHRGRAGCDEIHVVATQMDHNSVLRPFSELDALGVRTTVVPADPRTGLVDPGAVIDAIEPATALVAVVHASNVTGVIQQVEPIAAACNAAGVPILVDAAQSAGHLPIDTQALGIDLLAVPGHKGLLGPLGTGALLIRPGLENEMATIRQGGTGSQSELAEQPRVMPDRFEPGSHNTPGIVGLSEGIAYLLERSVEAIRAHEVRLIERMLAALPQLEAAGYRMLGPADPAVRVGVFAFTHEQLSPAELAMVLETEHGILARAGLHCAPGVHEAMGTAATGGATRLSISPFTTIADIERTIAALEAVAVVA